MATDSGYKSTLRDDNSQYSPREQISQEMRRYSGVLSVYGEQQVMQSPAAIAALIAIHLLLRVLQLSLNSFFLLLLSSGLR